MTNRAGGNNLLRVGDLVEQLLNQSYARSAVLVASAVEGIERNPRIDRLLAQIEADAANGLPITPDSPLVRALRLELRDQLGGVRAIINNESGKLQEAAIRVGGQLARQLSLPGLGDDALGTLGIRWKTPDPEAVARLIDYASSEAWRAELNLFTKNIADDAMRVVIRGFVNGVNPTETARRLRETIGTSSLAQSENLMRTIQLTSYRSSLTLYHTANADIFSHKIRIATLGERTCVSCIAQHGTRMRIDEEIKDHHRGRCSAVAVVRGMERSITTGEVWFGQQSEATQKKIMGGAAYRAWKDGAVQLKDFVHPYENGVFGEMQREASLKGMLGAEANKYYRQKP